MKKKIGVIFGGNSPEYYISLQSAHSIISNIDSKYDVILIGITKDGDWYHYSGNVDKLLTDEWFNKDECTKVMISPNISDHGIIEFTDNEVIKTRIDVFFPILHGKNGEDGTVQGLIEVAGIPYVGCGVLSSAVCMDKFISHEIVNQNGIKTAKSIMINNYEDVNEYLEQINNIGYPVFVKPLRAGSSFGISKVNNEKELTKAVELAFNYDSKIIIEETINGIEVGCAVLGNNELIVGVVDEIQLEKSLGFFDYKEKYEERTSEIICPAVSMSKDKQEEIRELAKKIYRALDCKGFARIDMFLTSDGTIYLNEVNTIPGFTIHSRYPAMLKEIGLSFKDIVNKLIELEIA